MSDSNASGRKASRLVKVVDKIDFRADLLALNASVEMAGAGRHGSEFALVADEVRRLAYCRARAVQDPSIVEPESAF